MNMSTTATVLEPHSASALGLQGSGDLYLNQSNHPVHTAARKSTNDRREELELAERAAEPSTSIARGDQSPQPRPAVDLISSSSKLRERIQFFALCYSLFSAGWNDASQGPLLPKIQSVYHVSFAIVSLIFVANCIGYVIGSLSNILLTDKFGFGAVIALGSLAQTAGYCIMSPAPPFPVFVIAFSLLGFGIALQNAQANGFVASYRTNANTKMGILHAVYGSGALFSPLVATQFFQMNHWSFHYLVSLGIAISNVILLVTVFRFKTQDECLAQIGYPSPETETSEGSKFRHIFKLKAMHLLAFFILVYVGTEVTIGGWIVTYIRQVRGGGANSGYIPSGFFGGLTLGRVGLLWVNRKVGERFVVFIYVVLAIALELVIWLVPSLTGGIVAVSLLGILLGPVYPIVMSMSSRILPRWLLTGCIGWIAGFGQTGSAILPFITGVIASESGIQSLQPLLVSMMGVLFVLWALVQNAHQRAD